MGNEPIPRILQRGNTFCLNAHSNGEQPAALLNTGFMPGLLCALYSVPGCSCILCDSYYCSFQILEKETQFWETGQITCSRSHSWQMADRSTDPEPALLLRHHAVSHVTAQGWSSEMSVRLPHIFPQFLQDREAQCTNHIQKAKLSMGQEAGWWRLASEIIAS